jgi:hypothetical protein
MTTPFTFRFGSSSTSLSDIHEVRFKSGRARPSRRQGKPIHAFFTQGMQIIGVPPELIRLLGRSAIASLNGGVNFGDVEKASGTVNPKGTRLITSAHIETKDAIYLMRIENQVYMAMPDESEAHPLQTSAR